MRVKIYYVDQNTGAETFSDECDLPECFEDDEEYQTVTRRLLENGRACVGGGAAPLVLFVRA